MEGLIKELTKQLEEVVKEHPTEVNNDTYWRGVKIGLETAIEEARTFKIKNKMSKEAEEFFMQKTIENAKRPRMKKFLALVNREQEGKIMKEYTDKQLLLYSVIQKRELLNALADKFNDSTHTYVGQPMIEETLEAFNCG
tara:strand:+ start:608 stop:1027 length:420 start_codon:yes stop_codon:yes gene_type:complete